MRVLFLYLVTASQPAAIVHLMNYFIKHKLITLYLCA